MENKVVDQVEKKVNDFEETKAEKRVYVFSNQIAEMLIKKHGVRALLRIERGRTNPKKKVYVFYNSNELFDDFERMVLKLRAKNEKRGLKIEDVAVKPVVEDKAIVDVVEIAEIAEVEQDKEIKEIVEVGTEIEPVPEQESNTESESDIEIVEVAEDQGMTEPEIIEVGTLEPIVGIDDADLFGEDDGKPKSKKKSEK